MPQNVLDRITNKRVAKWCRKYSDTKVLAALVESAEGDGYKLDPKSGLLLRPAYSEEVMRNVGYTSLDIVFTRPVDLHVHTDVGEAFHVIDGTGVFHVYDGLKSEDLNVPSYIENLQFGCSDIFVPRFTPHTLRPDKNSYLEVRISCTGLMNPGSEVCRTSFDKYLPWIQYYRGK